MKDNEEEEEEEEDIPSTGTVGLVVTAVVVGTAHSLGMLVWLFHCRSDVHLTTSDACPGQPTVHSQPGANCRPKSMETHASDLLCMIDSGRGGHSETFNVEINYS